MYNVDYQTSSLLGYAPATPHPFNLRNPPTPNKKKTLKGFIETCQLGA